MDSLKNKILNDAKKQNKDDLAKKLRTKRRFKHGRRIIDPSYKAKAEKLLDELYEGSSIYKRKDKLYDLEILVANLLFYRKKFFGISLNRTYWVPGPYTHASYSVIDSVKKLNEKGYIEMFKGKGNENPDRAYDTKIRATDKLLENMQVMPEGIIEYPESLVELREDKYKGKKHVKKRLWYKDRKFTLDIKERLSRINEVNNKACVEHRGEKLHTTLIAVFTGDFKHHGRLHAQGFSYYQGLDGDERGEITIDGQPVVELDFGGLHIYMLYAQEGIQYWHDPYECIVSDPKHIIRPFMKKVLLPLINAQESWATMKKTGTQYRRSPYRNASSSVREQLIYDKRIPSDPTRKQKRKARQAKQARTELKKIGITNADQIIDAFKKAHPRIAHYFCTENKTGMKLMNKDAKIALDIVDHFAKQGIVCLPVHDSFIVQKQYRDELETVMRKTYKKHIGFRIRVKE